VTEIIYGRHAVLEALTSGEAILELHVSDRAKPEGTLRTILSRARELRVPIKFEPVQGLDRAVGTQAGPARHQGVVAVVSGYAYADVSDIVAAALRAGEELLVLVLDAIQDVHNAGALLRTAEAAGAHGVVLADTGGTAITPSVRKASAGAVAHMRVARTDVVDALDHLRARGVRVIGLDSESGPGLFDADLSGPLALVVGSEGHGLRPAVARRCDDFVHLPMHGRIASLNAAVAGSIALYEAVRRRSVSTTHDAERTG
jgi:23S rRNA (guanosine2251-2'-O)-methyltransferase